MKGREALRTKPKSVPRETVDGSSKILYTKDKIPIKTIYLGDISSKITEKKLKDYFKKFGSVTFVNIKRRGSKHVPYIYAFVTFKEPISASKALQENTHCILDERIKVTAADSLIQLKHHVTCEYSNENEDLKDETTHENQLSLLHLNDDCLSHITSFLELPELTNLSNTCTRFDRLLNVRFSLYKKLDTKIFRFLTLTTIVEILSKVSPYVKHIVCCGNSEPNGKRFRELLRKYCGNVKTLDCININVSVLERHIRIFKHLKTLNLQNCSVNDDLCAVLHHCGDLETLDLSGNREITGKHLHKICNLQTLNLAGCSHLKPEYFKILCMQIKVVSLNIEQCESLNHTSIETLVHTQTQLENLSISIGYFPSYLFYIYFSLTRLKSLKRLHIDCNYKICDVFFQELVKHRGEELEILVISKLCFNQKVEEAISSLKNLKVLAIYVCRNITNSFLTYLDTSTRLERLLIKQNKLVPNESILSLIKKSQTIKQIFVVKCGGLDPRLAYNAFEILRKQEREYPLTLLTDEGSIIDNTLHERRLSTTKRIKIEKTFFSTSWFILRPFFVTAIKKQNEKYLINTQVTPCFD